jgi:hypothetical protein
VSDDDTFGSSSPRKVGDSWPINKEAVAKGFSSAGFSVDVKDVADQTVYLRRTFDSPAGKELLIEAFMNAKNFKPAELPPGATIESGELKAEFSGIFPVDPARLPRESGESVEITIHMTLPNAAVEVTGYSIKKTTNYADGTEAVPATTPAAITPETAPAATATAPDTWSVTPAPSAETKPATTRPAAGSRPASAPAAAVPQAVQTLMKQTIALLEAEKYPEALEVMAGPLAKRLHDEKKFDKTVEEEIKPKGPAMLKALKAAQTATPASVTATSIKFDPAEPGGLPLTFHFIDGAWGIK